MPKFDIDVIPPHIDNFVENQFPPFYREDSPIYVAFMQAYYEYLQTPFKPLYFQRNFLPLTDVDQTTFDQFLILIKEKFLKGIQLNTRSNIRQIIKHATDIYRSKGSERAIDLLFRLVFEEAVDFYYPKDDLFKPSDGRWFRPRYLELSLNFNNRQLYHKKIVGITSGATAFVDSVIRRTFNSRLMDLAYISAIDGQFKEGEKVQPVDGSLSINQCSVIVGSLNDVIVNQSGAEFEIGDIVSLTSQDGGLAIGRVANTIDQTNEYDVVIDEGGYGYATTSNVWTSNTILTLDITNISNSYARRFFRLFDIITQPLVQISYINANGALNVGDFIQTYYPNNTMQGNGQILSIANTGSNGTIVASYFTNVGTMNATQFFKPSNVVVANTAPNGYFDITATGTFLDTANIQLFISNTSGTFTPGEQLIQYNEPFDNSYPWAISTLFSVVSNGSVLDLDIENLNDFSGPYYTGRGVHGGTSMASAHVDKVQMAIGVVTTNNTFLNLGNNFFTAPSVNGSVTTVGPYIAVNFAIANIQFTETVPLNTDLLSTYDSVQLNASQYNFPASVTANETSNIVSTMTFVNTTIGKIDSIHLTSFSASVITKNFLPLIRAYEPRVYDTKYDYVLTIANASGSFSNGEIITQPSSNARGMLMQTYDDGSLWLQRMRFSSNNDFITTSNVTTQITGSVSSVVANVTQVVLKLSPYHMGFNANLEANTVVSNGSITEIQVLDSGFGFIEGELVTVHKDTSDPAYLDGFGIASLTPPGIGTGFYLRPGAFPSSNKKIFDGFYWQEYSYEISSSQTLDKYKQLITDLVHVAGIKLFGRLVHKGIAQTTLGIETTIIHDTGDERITLTGDTRITRSGDIRTVI